MRKILFFQDDKKLWSSYSSENTATTSTNGRRVPRQKGAKQQGALSQERERGGGGEARVRVRHRGHEGARAV